MYTDVWRASVYALWIRLTLVMFSFFIIQLQDGIDTVWNRAPFLGRDRGRTYVVFISVRQNNIMFTPLYFIMFN